MPKPLSNASHAPVAQTGAFSRRSFLRMVGAAAASTALTGAIAACNALPTSPSKSSGGKIQLVYQDWRTDWFPQMAQEALAEFHATHPNIRVFYVADPENLEEQMLLDMQAGSASDVFQGCCTHFPTWAQKGYTLDLRPYVKADLDQATLDDWDPAQYKALFLPDGRQFGVPKYHGALALFFNKDLFDQYRMPYPDATWTYQEYLHAMIHLTDDRNDDGRVDLWGSMVDISWDRLQVQVNRWGGRFVDESNPSRCLMAQPAAKEAFEWLRARMWDDKVMPSKLRIQNLGTRQAFVAGRLAMVEDGSWALKDVLEGAGFRVGVAPLPAGPARRVTLASTDGFGIFAGCKHPDAAWELVKFLISKDYGRAMARAHLLQPARASLVEEWADYVRQSYQGKTTGADIATFAEGHIKGYSVTTEIFPNMGDAKRLADAAWDRIFNYGEAPVSAMDLVAQQIEAAQSKAGADIIGGACCS
jgi:multiple sugar transport system substrate-binding protein